MRHFILALCCLTPVLTLSTVRRAAIETPEPTVTRADIQKTVACVGWFCDAKTAFAEPTHSVKNGLNLGLTQKHNAAPAPVLCRFGT